MPGFGPRSGRRKEDSDSGAGLALGIEAELVKT